MNLNSLKNGHYIKAQICGIKEREISSRKTGEIFTFYSLVVETDATAQKQYIEFTKRQIENGLAQRLSNPKYKGLTALIPVYNITNDKGFTTVYLSGEDLPLILSEEAPSMNKVPSPANTVKTSATV